MEAHHLDRRIGILYPILILKNDFSSAYLKLLKVMFEQEHCRKTEAGCMFGEQFDKNVEAS